MRYYLLIALTVLAIPFAAVLGMLLAIVATPFALYDFYFGARQGHSYSFLSALRMLVAIMTERAPAQR